MKTLTIKTQLSQEQFVEAIIQMSRQRLLFFRGAGIAILIFAALSFVFDQNPIPLTSFLILGFISSIFLFLFPILIRYGGKQRYEQDPKSGEEVDFIFDAEQLQLKGETFQTAYPWKRVRKVTESQDFILFWTTKLTTHPIPKASMSSDERSKLQGLLNSIDGLRVMLRG